MLIQEIGHMKSNLVFVQARVDSSRLPNKVLLPINGRPMIDVQIARIKKSKRIDDLIVVIPDTKSNDVLFNHLETMGVKVFRGSTNDVLQRFISASNAHKSESIIRITADCPLIMPNLLDQMILYFNQQKVDYLSNTLEETFPDGLDIEIFKANILNRLSQFDLNSEEKEHVTLGIYRRPNIFKVSNFSNTLNLGKLRWTVDYLEDLEFIRRVFLHFEGREEDFDMNEVLDFIKQNPAQDNKISSSFRNISLSKNQKK